MTTTTYDLTAGWDATNRYTASGETDVRLCNNGVAPNFWAITTDDTEPTIQVSRGVMVAPGGSDSFILEDGERLWIAGRNSTATLVAG